MKKQFFKPIELPEYCFLSELVEWLAMGRVPEASYALNEKGSVCGEVVRIDDRFAAQQMPENFNNWWRGLNLLCTADELALMGIPQPAGYEEAIEFMSGMNAETTREVNHLVGDFAGSFDFTEKEIERLKSSNADPEHIEVYKSRLHLLRDTRANIDRFVPTINSVHPSVTQQLDRAWTVVFGAILDNRIQLEGIFWEPWNTDLAHTFDLGHSSEGLTLDEVRDRLPFETLPTPKIQLRLPWFLNQTGGELDDYFNLRVKTSAMDDLEPLFSQNKGGVQKNPNYISDAKTVLKGSIGKTRGRPSACPWVKVEDELYKLLASGEEFPNKTAVYHCASPIAKALSKHGVAPSDKTVKNNLTDVAGKLVAASKKRKRSSSQSNSNNS